MKQFDQITKLMDDMIEERKKRGICDDQSEILKNGVEFSYALESICGFGSRRYQIFRDWFMDNVYDDITDYDNTVVFYYDKVCNMHNTSEECSEDAKHDVKRYAVGQNSLDTIRRFFVSKKPEYHASIWFGGEKLDVDNVAKWVLDAIQCVDRHSCWLRGYSDVLNSYVPIIRNDNRVFDLRVCKGSYKDDTIPRGTIVMIELKDDASQSRKDERKAARAKRVKELIELYPRVTKNGGE